MSRYTKAYSRATLTVLALVMMPGTSRRAEAVPPEGFAPPGARPTGALRQPLESTASSGLTSDDRTFLYAAGDFTDTGADNCNDAAVIPVPVEPNGHRTLVTTSNGNYIPTGPDCGEDALLGDIWWEAFHIDLCANVTLNFCGTQPQRLQNFTFIAASCAPDGSSCGSFLAADATVNSQELCSRFPNACPKCPNANLSMTFNALPPGTYYYPIKCSGPTLRGECRRYILNITAQRCAGSCPGCRGACCDTAARTCADDVFGEDCQGSDQQFTLRERCCTMECRPTGTDYDAFGVELLSRVSPDEFPSAAGGAAGANDIWGYVSPAGREYAIVGLLEGTGFVDVTDPRAPVIIADIPDERSTWSDMAVFEQYAYNVNESGGGMQIIDLALIDEGVVTLLGSATGPLERAHNLYINTESGFAYACLTNITSGFLVYDLSDPTDPVPVGVWDESCVHDLFVVSYDACPYAGRSGQPCEIAFAFACGAGLKIVDVTDKTDMVTLATHAYPNLAYCHQGWLSEDRRYLFIDDEADERVSGIPATTYVVDVQDLANPLNVTSFTNDVCSIDHNLMVRGRLLFEANYSSGLRVFDVGDVDAIREVAYFDTHPEDNDTTFSGAWGVYSDFPSGIVVVSDRQRGLFVLRLCDDETGIRADCDESGAVDLRDIACLQRCYGQAPTDPQCRGADIDCNRTIDLADFIELTDALTGP